MRSSDDLFQLIKSLDRNEKRYFRLFSSLQQGDKNYMLVFDAIVEQDTYNEKKIIALFQKEKIASRFPLVKQYLYNLILKSMESYHSSISAELQRYLHRIEFLYEKELYSQCKKIIAKAKQLAEKYDLQLLLLELLNWESVLVTQQSFIGATGDTVKQIFDKIFSGIEQYKATTDYLLHTSLLFIKDTKTGHIRSQSDIKDLKRIMDNPLFHVDEQKLSFQSQYRFYAAHGVYFYMQNDYKKSLRYHQKQLKVWEANPHQINEYPLRYAHVMHTFFGSNYYLKQYKECAGIIEKLRKLQVKLPSIKNRIDFMTDDMNLVLCIETGEFNKGLQLVKSMEDKQNKKDIIMISEVEILIFQYNTAYLYFGVGNYHKANEYLNKVLNEMMDIKNDTQCFAHILSLLVHFEMGKQDLLEYKVKSVHRFLYKRNRLYKVETIVLDFIRKEVPKISSTVETQYIASLRKFFESLLTAMKAIANDPFERRAFDYFDFISWLESKVENRPFAEIVREKAISH